MCVYMCACLYACGCCFLHWQRDGELERFTKIGEPIGNRALLWHGSRLSNYVGILSRGTTFLQLLQYLPALPVAATSHSSGSES